MCMSMGYLTPVPLTFLTWTVSNSSPYSVSIQTVEHDSLPCTFKMLRGIFLYKQLLWIQILLPDGYHVDWTEEGPPSRER